MKKFLVLLLIVCAQHTYASTSFITRVVDGDTVLADYLGTPEKIRILGIDTPETDECLYSEATEYLESFFIETSEVVIISDGRDKYGRVLAYIILPSGDDIGEKLITKGYATYYRDDSYDKKESYKTLEATAREEKVGIWNKDVCPIQTTATPASSSSKQPEWLLILIKSLNVFAELVRTFYH